MILVKLVTILIVSLLLFPIVKVFWGMTQYKHQSMHLAVEDYQVLEGSMPTENRVVEELSLHPQVWMDVGEGELELVDESGTSGFMVGETAEYSDTSFSEAIYQSPFTWTARFLNFGPRKWVGYLGLGTVGLTYSLLVLTALFGRSVPILPEAAAMNPDLQVTDASPVNKQNLNRSSLSNSINLDPILDATDTLSGLPLNRVSLGDLKCPSGSIIASDPLAQPKMPPFNLEVAPGEYPVELLEVATKVGGKRIACAMLTFSGTRPVSWGLALRGEQRLKDLEDGQSFGFPVDAGMGCFMDQDSYQAYDQFLNQFYQTNPDGNTWDDFFAVRFFENTSSENPNEVGDWYQFEIPNSPKHNMAMFASGWGDGFYPAYWGFDEVGKPTHLVIDFMIVDFAEKE